MKLSQLFQKPEPEAYRVIRKLIEAGKGAEALKAAIASAPAHSGEAQFNYLHGLSLDLVGRHEEALPLFTKAAEQDPNLKEARERRDHLQHALARPAARKIPTHERPWGTSLPREPLLALQQALHNYTYRGTPMLKNPFDMALYPLLVWQLKPRTIIEIGSKSGGSALWFGDLLNNFSIDGHVYSVDIVPVTTVTHPRVTFMEGNARDLGQTLGSGFLKPLPRPWLVIEDADHAYESSIGALRHFHPWLQKGEYIVVEDGIISDLTEDAQFNSGPHRALKEFLGEHGQDYEIDGGLCDFFGYNLTWCTNGFLKKIQ